MSEQQSCEAIALLLKLLTAHAESPDAKYGPLVQALQLIGELLFADWCDRHRAAGH